MNRTPRGASCKDILTGISAYLDGELDAASCDVIDEHCRDCPRCAEVVQGLRETVGLCRQEALTPLPEPVRQRAQESVRQLLERLPDRASRS